MKPTRTGVSHQYGWICMNEYCDEYEEVHPAFSYAQALRLASKHCNLEGHKVSVDSSKYLTLELV